MWTPRVRLSPRSSHDSISPTLETRLTTADGMPAALVTMIQPDLEAGPSQISGMNYCIYGMEINTLKHIVEVVMMCKECGK